VSSELLNPELYPDPEFRAAAVLSRLAQPQMTTDEAKILAEHTAEISDKSWSADAVLYMVEANRLVFNAALDKFLVTLLKRLPAARWYTAQKTTQALGASLKRRTSGLEEAQLWAHLGLRVKLSSLVEGTA